uniref:G-protein coupled receptors family 3 profile domain-containing protein n=1 Tax=Leptobrachium leishanense TaxID=445787 RepID=A0A8C5PH96_9ANUR
MAGCLSRDSSHVFVVMFCLIILWGTSGTAVTQKLMTGCRISRAAMQFEYEYHQDGDVMIGGLTTVYTTMMVFNTWQKICLRIDAAEYKNLLAFILAIEEINRDPDILPNVTLGYHVFDSCGDEGKVIQSVLQILTGDSIEIPNYSCRNRGKLAGFIGDRWSHTSLPMAQILNLYGYAQITSGSTNSELSDRAVYPNFFRTVSGDRLVFVAVVKLLKHFDWNWVGIIRSRDESGERDVRELSHVITGHGICIEYIVTIDSEECLMCPETEWPDERRIRCTPKMYDFLSYENDIMALGFSVISVLFSLLTLLILGIFICYRVTPIVRANNLNLSFLLLGSILFSFLCVFLFLGRPVDITCKLRQTMFGTIFSVSVSSLLAKTLTVCIAFKATKPGSSWRKWVGFKVTNSIVLICSSLQFLINVIWLSVSPPFQEFDLHSYPGKIIIQCNEGSVTAFYSVFGYMGLLAAVSFLLAFMVRTLPDSFNEAKYITFSMLVFCSVWIAMIPAYLSTKGKDMVSVEVFAILASSAGILICIFFPKCYILLIKPELNKKILLLK